jgi:3-oxoacyl-[acyl-carrier-protein] synthase II
MPAASPRRIVITGFGLISPLGSSADAVWNNLIARRSGVGPLERVPGDFLPASFGAEARQFTGAVEDFGPLEKNLQRNIKKGVKLMCREIEMGVASAQLAMSNAALAAGTFAPDRTGTVYGSDYILTMPEEFEEGVRNCLNDDKQFEFSRWAQHGLPKVTPLWLLKYLPNMPASHIAIYNDLRGPSNSLTLREAAANLAVGEAYCTIVRGSADIMIAGATGTRIHPLRTVHASIQEELATNGVEPAKASRPFDLRRTGMVLGEGAGAIVLEELETARARGAQILAEVVGQGSSSVQDRAGVAHIDVAIKNAMQQALRNSGLSPDDIGHVHAHGLSTGKCDAEEAQAINAVFGRRVNPVPVTAAKSYFGNLGAGGGLVELICSLLALQHDRLFPVLNYETPDPACPIAVVQSDDAKPGDSFINVSVTPQGQASAVIIRRFA